METKKFYSIAEYEAAEARRVAAREAKDWAAYHAADEEVDMMRKSLLPEVGAKVTEYLYSDSHAFTVVKVINDNKIVVRQNVCSANGWDDLTEYVTNELEGELITISRRKSGSWYQVGRPAAWGEVRYRLGEWREYIDRSF